MHVNRELFSFAACLTVLAIMGCHGSDPVIEQNKNAQPTTDPNRAAWEIVLKAENEPTLRDARFFLSKADMTRVTDPDLREIVEYQNRLYDFCIDTGMPRDALRDINGMLSSINYKTLLHTVANKGVSKAPGEATRLADEGASLKLGLDKYQEIREVLARRYR